MIKCRKSASIMKVINDMCFCNNGSNNGEHKQQPIYESNNTVF